MSLKTAINLLPQFQSKVTREAFLSGKIRTSDLIIDLKTEAGKNATAKMYVPLVQKIANQYKNSSSLDFADLISAGMSGLADAINTFDPEKTDSPFKKFAAYRIQQAILADMTEYSHTLSGTNWYAVQTRGNQLDAVSIDSLIGNDDAIDTDKLGFLGIEDETAFKNLSKDKEEAWNDLFKLLEKKFTAKECNIFYRYFGVGEGYWGKREKSKDIAKSYGMSEGNIRNSIINKMLRFVTSDKKSREILDEIRELYECAILKDLIYLDNKQAIYEELISDDMLILLEELTRWNNSSSFKTAITFALDKLSVDDAKYIIQCLQDGFNFIDDSYKKHKLVITDFLRYIYPTENFTRMSDVAIIDKMTTLSEYSKEFNIKW